MLTSQTGAPLAKRRFGNTDLEVSRLAVGGWLGIRFDPNADPAAPPRLDDAHITGQEAAIAAVARAVELGINYFDTAPMYHAGLAETLLGIGLKALPPPIRRTVYVSTKVGQPPERPAQYDRDSVLWSFERSLKRLHTDQIDIVYIHDPLRDDHMTQILSPGAALDTLHELKAQGLIKAIGLGVRNHRFLQQAVESGRFDAILPSYDYTPIRDSAAAVMRLAAQRNMAVVNGSPYCAGLLAGINLDLAARKRPADSTHDVEYARRLLHWAKTQAVDLGVVAMQYSMRNPDITVTLAGPRDVAEVESNVRHATTPLPAGIWDALDDFLRTTRRPPQKARPVP